MSMDNAIAVLGERCAGRLKGITLRPPALRAPT
jgi:hypothetical protein